MIVDGYVDGSIVINIGTKPLQIKGIALELKWELC
jgi:hypothetical protein